VVPLPLKGKASGNDRLKAQTEWMMNTVIQNGAIFRLLDYIFVNSITESVGFGEPSP